METCNRSSMHMPLRYLLVQDKKERMEIIEMGSKVAALGSFRYVLDVWT
jgi:hypothetical protein